MEVLQQPIVQICETSESFIKMEKDLVPLIDVPKKSVFLCNSEIEIVKKANDDVKIFIDIGFVEP